jgi:hypothetical protein
MAVCFYLLFLLFQEKAWGGCCLNALQECSSSAKFTKRFLEKSLKGQSEKKVLQILLSVTKKDISDLHASRLTEGLIVEERCLKLIFHKGKLDKIKEREGCYRCQ